MKLQPDLKMTGLEDLEESRKNRPSLASVVIHLILIILASAVILPLILPFLFAFKTPLEFAYHPWNLPQQFRLENFQIAWEAVKLGQGMFNTFIVCLGAILTTVPPAAMAGYIFSRYRTKVTNVLFYVVMAGFFVPAQMVLIPLYKLDLKLQLINTLPGLFLAIATFGIPFWTMIYRSFFSTLPAELMEAAKIDGAGHWMIFFRIMLPLTKSASILAVLLTFMGAWSDFMLSLILLNSQNLFTLQLRVSQFMGQMGANYFPQYAAGVIISAAPTIILYIIFRKKIIEGTTLAGALKG
ncbi:carbohydrate ABC transporter membrane protein 2 (CUT1 family) [Hydrogenispora ethanolica]|jgi:ABC-type glycerol-3-phosphate transport system permease component|uniref:Carbohydrate ABC transporter membrane protein 2 (CUT1 family) n=1 Tax=Hydrogenispora ethanolica TaxID=1082276 RepID=A0A4R1R5P7_HYDET|nr:carbohydrate ABC transporter permease [Hydrogenispora ethanolica]TCL60854.1 carbohydrate ABC transporter membrane protein 2 (CUT1 family) [Hydrogenispora ethanolica]